MEMVNGATMSHSINTNVNIPSVLIFSFFKRVMKFSKCLWLDEPCNELKLGKRVGGRNNDEPDWHSNLGRPSPPNPKSVALINWAIWRQYSSWTVKTNFYQLLIFYFSTIFALNKLQSVFLYPVKELLCIAVFIYSECLSPDSTSILSCWLHWQDDLKFSFQNLMVIVISKQIF